MVQVDKPAVTAGDDARRSLAWHRAALTKANRNSKAGRDCVAAMRARYGR